MSDTLLDTADLADMRATLNLSLPDTATILRSTAADDGMGGQVLTWATVATVAVRVSPFPTRGARGEAVADRLAESGLWLLTFAVGTDVTERDRVEANGVTFEVLDVTAPRTYEVSVRVLARATV